MFAWPHSVCNDLTVSYPVHVRRRTRRHDSPIIDSLETVSDIREEKYDGIAELHDEDTDPQIRWSNSWRGFQESTSCLGAISLLSRSLSVR